MGGQGEGGEGGEGEGGEGEGKREGEKERIIMMAYVHNTRVNMQIIPEVPKTLQLA